MMYRRGVESFSLLHCSVSATFLVMADEKKEGPCSELQ